jgi:hypothetical protein
LEADFLTHPLLPLAVAVLAVAVVLVARPAWLVSASACPSNVRGSYDFCQHIKDVMAFVKRVDTDDYANIIRYISYVEQNDGTAWSYIVGYDGVCKVEMSSTYVAWSYDNMFQVGGDLVHEGALCRDYFDGNTADVRADEIAALRVQRQFLVRAGAPGYLVNYMDQLIAQGAPYLK